MSYKELKGNLFASKADALVNTVNCIGHMGKGIALEFRRRFPEMFEEYQNFCRKRLLRPGKILPYRRCHPWILNFAIKDDWKHPSRIEWVEQCLKKFCDWYPSQGLKSVAFPWMGAANGRIAIEKIQEVTRRYLADLKDIEVEVYTFDPEARDPLFDRLLILHSTLTVDDFAARSRLQPRYAKALYQLLENGSVRGLHGIMASEELGKVSLDRLYDFVNSFGNHDKTSAEKKAHPQSQMNLFSAHT